MRVAFAVDHEQRAASGFADAGEGYVMFGLYDRMRRRSGLRPEQRRAAPGAINEGPIRWWLGEGNRGHGQALFLENGGVGLVEVYIIPGAHQPVQVYGKHDVGLPDPISGAGQRHDARGNNPSIRVDNHDVGSVAAAMGVSGKIESDGGEPGLAVRYPRLGQTHGDAFCPGGIPPRRWDGRLCPCLARGCAAYLPVAKTHAALSGPQADASGHSRHAVRPAQQAAIQINGDPGARELDPARLPCAHFQTRVLESRQMLPARGF